MSSPSEGSTRLRSYAPLPCNRTVGRTRTAVRGGFVMGVREAGTVQIPKISGLGQRSCQVLMRAADTFGQKRKPSS